MFGKDGEAAEFEKIAWASIHSESIHERAKGLLEMARLKAFIELEHEEAIPFARAAADLYLKLDNPTEQFCASRLIADCHKELERHDECISELEKCLAIAESANSTEDIAHMQHNMAYCLIELKRHDEALSLVAQAAHFYEIEDMKAEQARSQILMVTALTNLERYSEALVQLEKANNLFSDLDDSIKVCECLARKAVLLVELEHFDAAGEAQDKAEALINMIGVDMFDLLIKFNRGRILAGKALHLLAIESFNELLNDLKGTNESDKIAQLTFCRAKSLAASGQVDAAIVDLKRLLVAIDELPKIDLKKAEVTAILQELLDAESVPLDGLGEFLSNQG